ncbi:MAG: dihydroneopterin aldolase [Methylophilaceae bacterium]|nr:dihydroneopterin aldolase [Methylophilaceae bacterium]
MDVIFLQEIKVDTRIGVPEWERTRPQTLLLDIEIGLPHNRACQSDAIADTIDYGRVVSRIREHLSQATFRLLEALAESVAQLIMREFGAPWVRVRVTKPGILPGIRQLGIILERGKKSVSPYP